MKKLCLFLLFAAVVANAAIGSTAQNSAPNTSTVDTTAAIAAAISLQLASTTATNVVLDDYSIKVYPN